MDDDLRTQILSMLRMTDIRRHEQDAVLARIRDVANSRLARLVPYLLTEPQLLALQAHGSTNVVQWVVRHVPHYTEVVRAIILDVADEAADINRVHAIA